MRKYKNFNCDDKVWRDVKTRAVAIDKGVSQYIEALVRRHLNTEEPLTEDELERYAASAPNSANTQAKKKIRRGK